MICAQLFTRESTGGSKDGISIIDSGILNLPKQETRETEPCRISIFRPEIYNPIFYKELIMYTVFVFNIMFVLTIDYKSSSFDFIRFCYRILLEHPTTESLHHFWGFHSFFLHLFCAIRAFILQTNFHTSNFRREMLEYQVIGITCLLSWQCFTVNLSFFIFCF